MRNFFLGAVFAITGPLSHAANIDVMVVDKDDNALSNVVVYFLPEQREGPVNPSSGIMDQINTQFTPHILAVQRNAEVSFPNSDSIQHHVYSFSPAKTFELALYKGLRANPVMFEKAGVVEMGCNVHDWMLGYIYVVDTPYFSKTDETGKARLDIPAGQYRLRAWHPRISDTPESYQLDLSINGEQSVKVTVPSSLLPDVNAYETSEDEFGDYE